VTPSDTPDYVNEFYIGRANAFHTAALGIAAFNVLQTIAFANVVAGPPPIYCRVDSPTGIIAVYAVLLLLMALYMAAIFMCDAFQGAYLDRAKLDIGGLRRRMRRYLLALMATTTVLSAGIFSIVMFVSPTMSVCIQNASPNIEIGIAL